MSKDMNFDKTADTILKIAALVGVSAAVFAFGYNYYQCTQDTWFAFFSAPVFLLALLVFSTALGLSDDVFGSFREMNIWSGPFRTRVASFLIYVLGYLSEVSIGAVAVYGFLAAGDAPNCIS